MREKLVEFLQRLDGAATCPGRASTARPTGADEVEADAEADAPGDIPDAALIATAAALDGR